MESEGSVPHTEAPTNCHYPEPFQPSSVLLIPVLKIHFHIIGSIWNVPKAELKLRFI